MKIPLTNVHVYSTAPRQEESKDAKGSAAGAVPPNAGEKQIAGLYIGGKRNPRLYAGLERTASDGKSVSSSQKSLSETTSQKSGSTGTHSIKSSLSSLRTISGFSWKSGSSKTSVSSAASGVGGRRIGRPVGVEGDGGGKAVRANKRRELEPGEARPAIEAVMQETERVLTSKGTLPEYDGEGKQAVNQFRAEISAAVVETLDNLADRKMGVYDLVKQGKKDPKAADDGWLKKTIHQGESYFKEQMEQALPDFEKLVDKKSLNFLSDHYKDKDIIAHSGVYDLIKTVSPKAADKFLKTDMRTMEHGLTSKGTVPEYRGDGKQAVDQFRAKINADVADAVTNLVDRKKDEYEQVLSDFGKLVDEKSLKFLSDHYKDKDVFAQSGVYDLIRTVSPKAADTFMAKQLNINF